MEAAERGRFLTTQEASRESLLRQWEGKKMPGSKVSSNLGGLHGTGHLQSGLHLRKKKIKIFQHCFCLKRQTYKYIELLLIILFHLFTKISLMKLGSIGSFQI